MRALIIIGLSSLFAFCNKHGSIETNSIAYVKEQGTIFLPDNSVWRNHIKVIEVLEEDHNFDHMATAVVKTIPTQYAEIASPFSGRVVKSYVTLGQKVSLNAPIYEVTSSDYFETQKEYLNAKQELHLSESQFQREQDLYNHGVGVRQEMEAAQTNFEMAKFAFRNAEEALKIFDMSPGKVRLGTPLIVRAPISGEIIENNIVIGQYLGEEAEALVKIANLDKVWIVARVKEKDAHNLVNYEKVGVLNNTDLSLPTFGTLIHINEVVDEESRSLEVFVEVDNKNRYWKPGMFTIIRFIDKSVEVITVPEKAVLQSEDSEFVFVKVGENRYQKRNIKTSGIEKGKAIVIEGLKASEVVVSEGGVYLLKAL